MFRLVLAIAIVLGFVTQSFAQDGPLKVRICSGGETGNYYWAAREIAQRLPPSMFEASVDTSSGSLDNERLLMNKKCDIGFVQSDVHSQFGIETPASREQLEVLKKLYTEYTQVVCPVASGWFSLSDMMNAAKTKRIMILGQDGTGTAETWRIISAVDDKYGPIERNNESVNINSADNLVADSNNTCMLWVSGLNSADMVSINAHSLSNPKRKQSMRLISMDDDRFLAIKNLNGDPIYTLETVAPKAPANGQPGLYENLITDTGTGWFGMSSPSVKMLAIPAYLVVRKDFKKLIGTQRLTRLNAAINDASPTIWNKVNPAGNE